jgi:hypothetical protein
MHREILGLEHGDPTEVDHRNGDPLDNRRQNLRVVSRAENAQNVPARGGTSPFRGVTWDKRKGRWMAQAKLGGRQRFIGYFDDDAEAGRAAAEWRRENMPFSEADAA